MSLGGSRGCSKAVGESEREVCKSKWLNTDGLGQASGVTIFYKSFEIMKLGGRKDKKANTGEHNDRKEPTDFWF